MSQETKKKLFRLNDTAKGIRLIDQNYRNNGGHNEYIIMEIQGYKSSPSKYCVITHDIYGHAGSVVMTKEEVSKEFGENIVA